jgi:hypothetical protein
VFFAPIKQRHGGSESKMGGRKTDTNMWDSGLF